MNPGAVARFHDAQTRLLGETYHRAWQQGVAAYEPDEDPSEGEEGSDAGLLVGGAAGALLAARGRSYRPPDSPDPEAQARAMTGARSSLDRMAGELMLLTAQPQHVERASAAAQAGDIAAQDIKSYAEGLAISDWAESNAWRLNAGDSVAWSGEQAGYAEAANRDGQLLEWLPEADERVCADCEELGAFPPMPLEEWPTHPGAGDTICNAGCRCVLQVSDEQVGPEGELPQLSQDQEDFMTELAERREPYAEGPATRPEGPLVGDRQLGLRAEALRAPDVNQVFHDHDGLYAQAEVTKPQYDALLRDAGARIGAPELGFKDALTQDGPAIITAPLKDGSPGGRAYEKVEGKYQGDWANLKDVVRGTIVVPTEKELLDGLNAIEEAVRANPGWHIVGIENRYSLEAGSKVNSGANGFGYRDVSMHLVAPNGHVTELQLNTVAMMRAKEFEGGHRLYEDVRSILERDAKTPRTAEEQKLVEQRTRESLDLYHRAERLANVSGDAPSVADAIARAVAGMSTEEATAALADGRVADTLTRHSPNGRLDAARQLRHTDIIVRAITDHAAQKAPEAMFTAGGPASGKSKFLKMPGAPSDAVVVDPDIIRKLLPEYQELVDAGRADIAAAATHEEASQIAKELTVAANRTRRNLIVDGVGDSAPGKFAAKIQQAVDAGYKVQVRYMHLATAEAEKRALIRFKNSGRLVPKAEIRQKHAEVSARYHEVLALKGVHRVSLFDNGGPKGSEPKLISSRGADGKLHVTDHATQREFEGKVRELRGEGGPLTSSPHDALIGDLGKLTPEHQRDVREQIAKLPDDVAGMLAARGVKVESGDSVYAHAHYDPRERVVKVDNFGFVLNKGQAPTILHELGHAFDHAVGNVSKDPAFRSLHKDANPKKGSYYSRGLGSGPYKTDPRQELFAEAAAHIWNGTEPPDFTLTPFLRELITELPKARAESSAAAGTAVEHTIGTLRGATGAPAKETQAAKMVERLDLATATPRDLIDIGKAVRAEVDAKVGARWDKRLAKAKAKRQESYAASKATFDDMARADLNTVGAAKQHGENSPEHLAALAEFERAQHTYEAAQTRDEKLREAYQRLRDSVDRYKRPEALMEALADIRPMGGEIAKAPGMAPMASGALDQAARRIPTEWLNRSNAVGDIKAVIVPEGVPSRANIATPAWEKKETYVAKDGIHQRGTGDFFYADSTIEAGVKEWADPSVVLHELSHRMEYVVPRLQEQLDAFWKQRTGHPLRDDPAILQKLSELTGNHAYEEHELADPDRFTQPYMGKVYTRGTPIFDPDGHVRVAAREGTPVHSAHAGEILTTGQEGVWFNRFDLMDTRFLGASERKAADEYVAFILGLLATL